MPSIDYASAKGDEYHRQRHAEFYQNPALERAWASYARRTYFPNLKPGQSILEIGAGLGINLIEVATLANVHAVEPSAEARAHCATLSVQTYAQLADLPRELKFDFVLLRHVLEHVQQPRAMLMEARACLSSTGVLVIAVPVESPKAAPDPNDPDHHLYSWTRQSLANLLMDAGYTQIETRLNFRNGRRLFLPVYKALGAEAYRAALTALGRMRGYCEILAFAHASQIRE